MMLKNPYQKAEGNTRGSVGGRTCCWKIDQHCPPARALSSTGSFCNKNYQTFAPEFPYFFFSSGLTSFPISFLTGLRVSLLELSELQLAALTLELRMQKIDKNDKPAANSKRNLTQVFNDDVIHIKLIC
jgi:hypothetical protein